MNNILANFAFSRRSLRSKSDAKHTKQRKEREEIWE